MRLLNVMIDLFDYGDSNGDHPNAGFWEFQEIESMLAPNWKNTNKKNGVKMT